MSKKSLILFSCCSIGLLGVLTVAYLSGQENTGIKTGSDSSTDTSQIQTEVSDITHVTSRVEETPVTTQTPEPQSVNICDEVKSVPMSASYLMHGRIYAQNEVKSEITSSFGWDGDMRIQINSAELIDYEKGTYGEAEESWKRLETSNPRILLLDITLENINAKRKTGVQYEFHYSVFTLAALSDFSETNYMNVEHIPALIEHCATDTPYVSIHGDGDQRLHFTLKEGEIMNFKMAYCIDAKYLAESDESLVMAMGIGNKQNDIILLDVEEK